MDRDLNSTFILPAASLRGPAAETLAGIILMSDFLKNFITQSNAIENIDGYTERELFAYDRLLSVPKERIDVQFVSSLVSVIADGAPLRLRADQNVRVGPHIAPKGGPRIGHRLALILDLWHAGTEYQPIGLHNLYLWLHPFMDGNGRSARALWLRMAWDLDAGLIVRRLREKSLLECLYYDSLAFYDDDGLDLMQYIERNAP